MGCLLRAGGGLYPRLVVGAVLLAAGPAERLGGRPTPLLELAGVPLIRRNLIALSGAGVDELAVVTGHRADEVERAVTDFPLTVVRNADYPAGRMSSVRAGLAALSGRLDAIIIALADQPLLTAGDYTAVIGAYKRRTRGDLVIPFVGDRPGNPIVIDAALRDALLGGEVEPVGHQWIAAYPERVVRFDTDNPHYLVSLDTPADLERFHRDYGHELRWPAASTTLARATT